MTKQIKNNSHNTDKRIIDIFVEISKQGKKTRLFSLFFLLFLLIAGIYCAIKINILALFAPIIFVPLMRRFTNPLHDKNIKKYLSNNSKKIDSDISQKILNLSKDQKLHFCKEALLIQIRSKFQQHRS